MDSEATTITTGEGVALDVVPAGISLRVLSALIDAAVTISLLIGLVTIVLAGPNAVDSVKTETLTILVFIACFFALPVLLETATGGKSIGRYATGTRVVRTDMSRIGLEHAAVRTMIGLIELWSTIGGLAVATALFDSKNRRIGDLAAGTMVIKERLGSTAMQAASSRVEYLEAQERNAATTPDWIRHADLRKLPPQTAQAARAVLTRGSQFDPAAHDKLLRDIANELRAYVFPGPPPQVRDEEFIQVVLAERTRRESIRMKQHQRLAKSFLKR